MSDVAPREILAIDIGGTKLAAGVVDGSGSLTLHRQVATPQTDGEQIFDELAAIVLEVLAAADRPLAACGVGCGGPMVGFGLTVSPLNIPGWRRFPLRSRLTKLTGLPVAIDNDAKALALGEGWVGAAAGLQNYLAMVVSTGIGGGIVLDGRLLNGSGGNAGHIGHVVVEPEGRPCVCGSRGCLEAEASGLAIAKATGHPPADASHEVIRRAGTLVGRGVASVANLLDLELAVVAGSVALGFGAPFFAAAQSELDTRCRLEFSQGTRIVPAGLGSHGPLVGAAAVARAAIGLGHGADTDSDTVHVS